MAYSLILIFDGYIELINTFGTLQGCLDAAAPLKGVCMDVGLLQEYARNG